MRQKVFLTNADFTLLPNQAGQESVIAQKQVPAGFVYQFAYDEPSFFAVAYMESLTSDGLGDCTLTALAEPCARWQTAGSLDGVTGKLDRGSDVNPGRVVAAYKSGPTLSACSAITYTTGVCRFADATTDLYVHYLVKGASLIINAYSAGVGVIKAEDRIAEIPLNLLHQMDNIGANQYTHALTTFYKTAWLPPRFVIQLRVNLTYAYVDTGYAEATYGKHLTQIQIPCWVEPAEEFCKRMGFKSEKEMALYRVSTMQAGG